MSKKPIKIWFIFKNKCWQTLLFFCFCTFLSCVDSDSSVTVLEPVSLFLGNTESCISCHGTVTGFSPGHAPEVIGCTPCHLGNPNSDKKKLAHSNMVSIPGNLVDVKATCGNTACHPEISTNIFNSLMTTMSGVVSVNRSVFNSPDTTGTFPHVQNLKTDTPSDTHLRQLCASCHLGNEKKEFGPIHEKSRGGGCNACHLNYAENALNDLDKYSNGSMEDGLIDFHPSLSLQVTNNHCFGCHSRSGRISTNYEGWHETTLSEVPQSEASQYRLLEDGRIFEKQLDDLHHSRGLECIDCHTSTELMGKGQLYAHKSEALEIQCSDCHTSKQPETVSFDVLTSIQKKILGLRNQNALDQKFLRIEKTGSAIINSYADSLGEFFLIGKNSRDTFSLKSTAEICTKDAVHSRLTCDACHTGWSPQCLGCHTQYDPSLKSIDLLTHQQKEGRWNEHLGTFLAELPPLGIVQETDTNGMQLEKIKTFMAGMILTIDQSEFPGKENDSTIFKRLFAPASPHTTQVIGRSCASCHSNPVALGYGRGKLIYQIKNNIGEWHFEPEYEVYEYDGLPQDAWIDFLSEPKEGTTTRKEARPFSRQEQSRILRVGACLTCHKEAGDIMQRSLEGFEDVLTEVSSQCILPAF